MNNPKGKLVGEHAGDAAPEVEFDAPKAGTYTITVRVAEIRARGGAFVTLFLLRKGGSKVAADETKAALERLIEGCGDVSQAVRKKVRFQFGKARNGNYQWALYGAVLSPDEAVTVPDVWFGKGERMVLAAGDSNAEDVDLAILNSDGEVLLKDGEPTRVDGREVRARAAEQAVRLFNRL